MSRLRSAIVVLALLGFSLAWAGEEDQVSLLSGENYLVRIGTDAPHDLERALIRIDQLFSAEINAVQYDPVVMVLHGPEVAIFLRDNYAEHKHLVDLAARLTAFGVLDIRVCETRMGVMGSSPQALVPFVGVVPFGPDEIEQLVDDQGYVYF